MHPGAQRGHHALRRASTSPAASTPCSRPSRSGSVANLVGSWIAYAVGYYGRVDLLEKHGRKLHIKPKHLHWADSLVPAPRRRHRLLHADAADHPHLHLPARRRRADAVLALQRAHAGRAACRGCSCSRCIGMQAGERWENWKDSLHYFDYAVAAAIVIGLVYLCSCRARPAARTRTSGAAAPADRDTRRPSGVGLAASTPRRRLRLPLAHAVALGALQGPAELLPVSSSGHLALVPALLGWPYAALEPSCARPSRWPCTPARRRRCRSPCARGGRGVCAASAAARRWARARLPAARAGGRGAGATDRARGWGACARSPLAQVAGGRRAGGSPTVAPPTGRWPTPGCSTTSSSASARRPRSCPASPATAPASPPLRLRRFERPAAHRLSRHAALPIILAATALKGTRLARTGLPPGLAGPFAAGTLAAFGSTLASARLIPRMDRARPTRPSRSTGLGWGASRSGRRASPPPPFGSCAPDASLGSGP